ncbi:AfsR/SARP family transcriptional regulator [Amycolatopsis sp. RTGN1]|uniref:AfsR/SARP family transcriptional regulator n=1 Tax=Amycolatopsis ponsaeliensis TaxID=2992142 RepID=UPI00254FD4FF|nr:BTAD domain-containing putative transcriptional regulator [Amycolatopsis sp. RTGN1]
MSTRRPPDDGAAPPFRVLGPFEVFVDDRRLELGGPRIRTLLALLTANAGRVMQVGALVDALWGTDAPPDGAQTVRTYVSRLRRSLSAAGRLIVTHQVGYALRLVPGALDAGNFERLVATGRDALTASRHADAVTRLTSALELWRGDAYAEFGDVPLLHSEAGRLAAMRLAATEDRIDAELATGASSGLLDELTELTERHPGHDRVWGQLMIALYRAGRQVDAVEVFGRARAVLVGRFGLDPSAQLTEIHRRLLNNDARLLGVPAAVTTTSVPARDDLPGAVARFTGRAAELSRLLAVPTGPPAAVAAIDGMAGIGKTTLAVHAAHLLADHYRDARLFLDLHGHTPGRAPTTPMAALDTLLRALGVPGGRIPDDLDARAALWRAELATRSVLVVLDDAADLAQLRPLLPGTARTLVLVTSRHRLVGLDSALSVSLDVLPEADAAALFAGVLGDDRAADAGAVHDVVDRCGYLPLAIRLAAARLRARPSWPVRYLAERLRGLGWPLAELEADDCGVAAALAPSCDRLAPPARRMFRLLGLHPGPDFDAPAAAALAAIAVPEAERLLEHLVDDHLLRQSAAGRYRFHALVRRHAHAAALAEESEPERRAALRRVVDFSRHTTHRPSDERPPISLGPAAAVSFPSSTPATAADATPAEVVRIAGFAREIRS